MDPSKRAPSRIDLRPIRPGDKDLLVRIYSGTREAERDAVHWEEDEWSAFVRMQYDAQRSHYEQQFPNAEHLIVLRHGSPAGRIWVDRTDREIRLLDIAILPEHRRCGIGTFLIRRLQSEAEEKGIPLRHSVELGNPGARRLYERLGFAAIVTRGLHTLMEWNPASETDSSDEVSSSDRLNDHATESG